MSYAERLRAQAVEARQLAKDITTETDDRAALRAFADELDRMAAVIERKRADHL